MALYNASQLRLPGFKLAVIGCLCAVIVLAMGAFTRLADAGLGCPDWPTCYGHALWPTNSEEVAIANQAFPDMPVEHDKTWPEMVHRYFAQALGYFTIALFTIAALRRRQPQPVKVISGLLVVNVLMTVLTAIIGVSVEPFAVCSVAITMLVLGYFGVKSGVSSFPFKLPAFILAFIILQGLFGMWTVTLKLWPQVVTAHLLGGFTTFSLLWLLVLRLNNSFWQLSKSNLQQLRSLRPLVVGGLIIVFLQIALGGWTTSNYAAVACPDLPTCQQQWLPVMNFAQGFNITQHIGPNYLGGTMNNESRIAIHFSHRIGAIVTTLYLVALVVMLFRSVAVPQVRTLGKVVLAVLALQVALGLGNIIFQFPVFVAVAHNLVGAFLLVILVTLNHRVFTARLADSSTNENL